MHYYPPLKPWTSWSGSDGGDALRFLLYFVCYPSLETVFGMRMRMCVFVCSLGFGACWYVYVLLNVRVWVRYARVLILGVD